MILNETLTLIAAQVKADPQALMAFAAEDQLGGYHIDEAQRKFPMGSLWGVEGQILYALVRWLKPAKVVEVGGWAGASAAHLALAVEANGIGQVISVDNYEGDSKSTVGHGHGDLIPAALRQYVTLVNQDGRVWLAQQPSHSIGLLFEDADHSTTLVKELSRLALQKLEAGGVMVNHDAAHDFALIGGGQRISSAVGRAIRDGLEQAGLYFTPYLAEPSDCGLAITVIPGARAGEHSQKIGIQKQSDVPAPQYGIGPIESDTPPAPLELPDPVAKGEHDEAVVKDDPKVAAELTKPVTPSKRGGKAGKPKASK